jgi:CubicO group peptidase (beta-lactamase class C family)
MRILAVIITLSISTIASTCDGADPRNTDREQVELPVQRGSDETLSSFLSRVRDHYGVPAMAVAVFRSEGIVEAAAVGSPCVGSSGEVSADSRFHIGSLGKSMTATVAATYVEAGALSWETTIAHAFPELMDVTTPAFAAVTLRDLLMHRGGFAPWWSDDDEFAVHDVVPGLQGTPRQQRERFVGWLLRQPEYVTPGEVQYSNAGYVVATVMLERAAGQPWEWLINRRLFRPLGMKSAAVGWPRDAELEAPCGHLRDERGQPYAAPLEYHRLPVVFAPSGDLHMSVRDLAKYGMTHLGGLRGSDGLLRSETIEYLHTPVGDYALGWGVGTSPQGERGSGHEGSAGTFFAVIGLSHDRDIGGVVLVNDGSENARGASENVTLELLFNE